MSDDGQGASHGSPAAWAGVGCIIAAAISLSLAMITGRWVVFLTAMAVLGLAGLFFMWRGRVMQDVMTE